MAAKIRASCNLGPSSSKSPTEKPAEAAQSLSESAQPSIYDMQQVPQEQTPPLYESGPGDVIV